MPTDPNSGSSLSPPTDSWLVRIAGGSASDLRQAVRRLRREKGFTAVTLLTLALCIGTTTAIFSMVYALLLKPLPFPEPTRIVEIYNTFHKAGLDKMPSNVVQYVDYKTNTHSYAAVGLWRLTDVMVGEEGAAERVTGAECTADMFDILRVSPEIGRFFTLDNSHPGADRVLVLTQAFWESHFHEDPGVLGQTLRVDGQNYQIIGVAPRSIAAFDARVRFIRPYAYKPEAAHGGRFALFISLFARLKPGVPVSQALGEATALERHYYDSASPMTRQFLDRAGHKIAVGPVQAERAEPVRSSLYLLQGGVAFVLLIGCVNVANLLLARANGRQSDLAIRSALGASQSAIARQLLIESLALTLAGSALGIGLAWGAVQIINRFSATMLPDMLPFALDGRVLGFAVVLSVVAGVLIGLLPVAHILRTNLAEVIHRTSRAASGGRGVRALSSVLVVGQVAVALILLTGAGLLIHSFANALAVDPGFDPHNLVTGRMALPTAYRTQVRSTALQQQLLQALQDTPGVTDAALSTSVPFAGGLPINALSLKETVLARDAPQPGAYQVAASVGYFQALHIPLVAGRFFVAADTTAARQPFIVDERFAQRYFPGRSAVGAHFTFGGIPAKDSDWPEIVGVVRTVPHNGVEDRSHIPFVYFPLQRSNPGGLTLFVRSSRSLGDTVVALRAALRRVDPAIPLFDTGTVQAAIDDSFDHRRAVMLLLGGFAGLALFLSAIGIYGVLAYDVSQRTREIGIRGAIGASRPAIIGLIMRQGLWKTSLGLGIGLAGAMLLSHYMVDLLFELKTTDPWTYLSVCAILAVVAALASYLPARRAAKIDPLVALRVD
jgi:putative ABC transport system permease protein